MSQRYQGRFRYTTIKTATFYPFNGRRKISQAYRKVREQLVVVLDVPCRVCGVTNSILRCRATRQNASLNPFNATRMETHHCVIEWALTKAIDLEKFNKFVIAPLRKANPKNPAYRDPRHPRCARKFTQEEMEAWIDNSPDNLMVLCDVHHRQSWLGIHAIAGPIWGSLDLLKPDWPLTPPNQPAASWACFGKVGRWGQRLA